MNGSMPSRFTVSMKSSPSLPQIQIAVDDALDGIRDLFIGDRGPEQLTQRRVLVGLAAQRDLVEFLAVLFDAEEADMADMMMAAGIDAARDVDVQAARCMRASQSDSKRRANSMANGIERALARLQ